MSAFGKLVGQEKGRIVENVHADLSEDEKLKFARAVINKILKDSVAVNSADYKLAYSTLRSNLRAGDIEFGSFMRGRKDSLNSQTTIDDILNILFERYKIHYQLVTLNENFGNEQKAEESIEYLNDEERRILQDKLTKLFKWDLPRPQIGGPIITRYEFFERVNDASDSGAPFINETILTSLKPSAQDQRPIDARLGRALLKIANECLLEFENAPPKPTPPPKKVKEETPYLDEEIFTTLKEKLTKIFNWEARRYTIHEQKITQNEFITAVNKRLDERNIEGVELKTNHLTNIRKYKDCRMSPQLADIIIEVADEYLAKWDSLPSLAERNRQIKIRTMQKPRYRKGNHYHA